MPAFDRKVRFALIAAVAGASVVAWLALRGGGEEKVATRAVGGGGAAAGDPWAAGDRPGKPGFKRSGSAPGLHLRVPGPPAQVTGLVRLAGAGTPVAGAEVAFMNETGESTVTADGSGRYTIQVASGVRWKVHARTGDAVGYPEPFEVTGATAVRDLEIQALVTVRGRVVDSAGRVVAGADVNIEVEGSARNLLESAFAMSTQSDAAGRFELRALAGGARVRAARGMAQGLATIANIAAGATADVEIRVQAPVRLRGTVVDRETRPQAGATIKALAALEPGVYERKQVTAGSDGSFELELPTGWVRLEAAAGGERAPVWSQSLTEGAVIDNLQLVVGAGEVVRGQVVTSDGTPVVGARVRLVAATTFDAFTSGDGRFEMSVPERIPYLVKVRHSDGYVQRQVATWGEDERFVMPRFGHLIIKVAGAGADAKVQLDSFVPAGEAGARPPAEASFRGSRDVITVDNLEPGHYRMTVTAPGSAPIGVEAEVPADGTAELDVRLEPAAVGAGKLGALVVVTEARPC